MKTTYEELEAELHKTRKELVETQKLLTKALDEIANLQEKLNLNSKNSSRPPSAGQKGNTSSNSPKKRKQRKDFSRSRFSPERIDKYVECTRENCPHCGSNSIRLSNRLPEILQQAKLPEIRATIIEYQLLKYSCISCAKSFTADLPKGIPHSAFGPKLMGLMRTLTGLFHLAKREAIELIKDLYGVDIGLGSAPNIEERVSDALEPVYHRIHNFVIESEFCKHFDETRWGDCGKRHYAWLAGCKHAAFYMIDRTRSGKAFQKLVGKDPSEFSAVTDRYAVYNCIKKQHQYCLAHFLREFRRYAERDGPDKRIGQALKAGLSKICRIHGEYREKKITLSQRNRRLKRQKQKVETWLEGGTANRSNRLTRSDRGKRFVERITTVAQTLKRQGKNVLSFIQEILERFYSKERPPFISEAMGF